MTKTITLVLFLAAVLFGQDNKGTKVLTHSQADLAWANAYTFPNPGDLKTVSGGGLVVEPQVNDYGRRAVAVYSLPGTYLFQGESCRGGKDKRELGQFEIDYPSQSHPFTQPIYDSNADNTAQPLVGPLCSLTMYRFYQGTLEASTVALNPHEPSPQQDIRVVAESWSDNVYTININQSLPDGSVVIVGRSFVGEIRSLLGGAQVSFRDGWLPYLGPTSLTVCSRARCTTITYERRIETGGKG